MTAYGRGQAQQDEVAWSAEVRTVNSRFLDLHLHLPRGLNGLEDRISKLVAARLSRGRVDLNLTLSGKAQGVTRLVLDRQLLEQYRQVVEQLRQELGLKQEPGLEAYLANRDLFLLQEQEEDLEQTWSQVQQALEQALDEAEAMRAAEGRSLALDLESRLERLAELFEQAAGFASQVVETYRQRLADRLEKLLDQVQPDPQRLAQEVAFLADKCDISEEVVRAGSHLKQFRGFLQSPEPVGRKLDFLLQELNREANTIGSKTPDAQAAQVIVEIKAELERMREQVQNIE